jgi:hypothetical protein
VSTGLLAHPPTQVELERLYYELALVGAPSVGRKRNWPYRPENREALLVLAAEFLRYDPRLLSILLQFLLGHYRELNPMLIRRWMHRMRWPQALLVLLEFTKIATADQELLHMCNYLAAGFSRIEPDERFFIDAERPGSRMAARGLGRNLDAYGRWGLIGNEKPIVDPVTKRTVGRYGSDTRKRILTDLAATGVEFSLADYLAAVDNAISRQQALKDLQALPGLHSSGHGRGAKWRMKKGAANRTPKSPP